MRPLFSRLLYWVQGVPRPSLHRTRSSPRARAGRWSAGPSRPATESSPRLLPLSAKAGRKDRAGEHAVSGIRGRKAAPPTQTNPTRRASTDHHTRAPSGSSRPPPCSGPPPPRSTRRSTIHPTVRSYPQKARAGRQFSRTPLPTGM